MNADYEYFVNKSLEKYSGDWVIIVKERVVAHAPRTKLTEMLWQDKKNYPRKSLFVAKVPRGAEQIL